MWTAAGESRPRDGCWPVSCVGKPSDYGKLCCHASCSTSLLEVHFLVRDNAEWRAKQDGLQVPALASSSLSNEQRPRIVKQINLFLP